MPTRQAPAGARPYQVTIEQRVESKAPSGMVKADWTHLIDVEASKEDTSGRERFAANQTSSPYDSTWNLPYVPSMDPDVINVPKMRRLVYQGRVYDITAARLVGWHRAIELETLSGGTVL